VRAEFAIYNLTLLNQMHSLDVKCKIAVAKLSPTSNPTSTPSLALCVERSNICMILVSAQKIFYILPDFFEHVGQFVTRFKLHESNISVLLSKGQRILNGYDGVLGSMKNEGWLTKCGKWFVASRILQQFIADWHVASLGVMEDRHAAVFFP